MIWIIGIIGFLVVVFLFKFASATSADTNYVKDNGGMRVMYSALIQGVVKDRRSARVREGSLNYLTIEGEFSDIVGGAYRGVWALHIQHTFKMLQVTYKADMKINGGEFVNKKWDFPVDLDQNRMVEIITTEMNQAVLYGLYQ